MKIREVNENKKQFISLLLLADEQESMVERYLEKGTMYVLEDNDEKAECVVTDEGNGILEIKNIAVDPENQGKGYGKALIDCLADNIGSSVSISSIFFSLLVFISSIRLDSLFSLFCTFSSIDLSPSGISL